MQRYALISSTLPSLSITPYCLFKYADGANFIRYEVSHISEAVSYTLTVLTHFFFNDIFQNLIMQWLNLSTRSGQYCNSLKKISIIYFDFQAFERVFVEFQQQQKFIAVVLTVNILGDLKRWVIHK